MRLRKGWVWHFSELTKDASAKAMKEVDAYLQPILEEAIRRNKSQIAGKEKDTEDETLLDHLVKLTDSSSLSCCLRTGAVIDSHVSSLGPTVLHDETLNILIAGRDTVSPRCMHVVLLILTYKARRLLQL